jgi:hypothetical protein
VNRFHLSNLSLDIKPCVAFDVRDIELVVLFIEDARRVLAVFAAFDEAVTFCHETTILFAAAAAEFAILAVSAVTLSIASILIIGI